MSQQMEFICAGQTARLSLSMFRVLGEKMAIGLRLGPLLPIKATRRNRPTEMEYRATAEPFLLTISLLALIVSGSCLMVRRDQMGLAAFPCSLTNVP